MSGVYIHIPFCRQRCHYCDFYKTLKTSLIPGFIGALKKEIVERKNYTGGENIETIYFGGGTPSVLTQNQLAEILDVLNSQFNILPGAEVTLEANPDDLTKEYLQQIYNAGINRLSIGIQSFNNRHLKNMNRRHNAKQATDAVENAAKTGFRNISVDLIYGLPDLTTDEWRADLKQVFELPVQHLSAYHLTYHEGTVFYDRIKKGTLTETKEEESVLQFNILTEESENNGFRQYEISNFAKEGFMSKHNKSYWFGKKYIGAGPSAHSFNGSSRQWNISDTAKYIEAINTGKLFYEEEKLTENDRYNEYILTRIRTVWGVSANYIESEFGDKKLKYFLGNIEKYLTTGLVIRNGNIFTLSREGLFVSDEIMTNLISL